MCDMKRSTKYLGFVCVLTFIIVIGFAFVDVQGEDELSLTFYGQYGCSTCHDKAELIDDFVAEHSEVNATLLWIPYNLTIEQYYEQLNALGETSPPPPPAVILNRSGEIIIIFSVDITWKNLDAWRLGQPLNPTDFTLWIAFVTGLVTGASACMLLLLSVLGTSLTMIESRSKYLVISTGLIIGLIVAYLAVSFIFLMTINALSVITYLKYIFGAILLGLGVWQIIEYRREDSIIFGTSPRMKSTLKDFINKNSGLYAFLVGVIFAFIKIPCFGAPYLQLLFFSQNDPALVFLIIFYFVGMLIPIVAILMAIRIGFQSEKINEIRKEYRSYLRLLSGCLIITLTLYLFLDLYISIELILCIILIETLLFLFLIWVKSRQPTHNERVSAEVQ